MVPDLWSTGRTYSKTYGEIHGLPWFFMALPDNIVGIADTGLVCDGMI